MDNLEEAEVIGKIQKEKHITFDIKEKYFKGKSFKEICNWLEFHNIDRHITIDIKSAGVIILVSSLNENNKVLVQVRASLYLLKLSEYPIIKLNRESNGILVISKDNYNDYINIKDTNSLQLHICWQNIISQILGI